MTVITEDEHVMLECHRPDGTIEYVDITDPTFAESELDEWSEAK